MSSGPSTFILEILEDVGIAFLSSQDLGDIPVENVDQGVRVEGDDSPLPAVTVICNSADHSAPYSGQWLCSLTVEVRSNADDILKPGQVLLPGGLVSRDIESRDEHHARVRKVFGFFLTSTIKNDLNAAALAAEIDFTTQLVVARRVAKGVIGRSWIATLELDVDCCGSVIDLS
jgi:hypothetical protein